MKALSFAISLLLFSGNTYAQPGDSIVPRHNEILRLERYWSILGGYNGGCYHYGELGLAINQYGVVGHHPTAWAFFVSSEMRISDQLLLAPKAGAWIGGGSGGMAMGINLLCYTDTKQASWRIRPEIGIGFHRFKVVYGYNVPLNGRSLPGVSTHNLGIAWLFGVKKIPIPAQETAR